jgi:hypothetical protein
MATYRSLTVNEIEQLQRQGCCCGDWTKVEVKDPFKASRYRDVNFSGNISLGTAMGSHSRDGVELLSGIYNATLNNCSVGDNVYIKAISGYISNYDIADEAIIIGAGTIVGHAEATFGIGQQVAVLNEAGGREVPIFEELSSQLAYIIAMYRHDQRLTARLNALIQQRRDAARSGRGHIGKGADIVNTATIIDVNVGDYAKVYGALRLTNGTIISSAKAQTAVGDGVVASDFIIAEGAKIDNGSIVSRVFVGQASHLSQFTAHDSLFFANSICENGEAASIFAGPYTVTMHKSTLLIGSMMSFFNAGSGSNQSNHMYKLGPVHQGILGRGSKTASGSHILWPAKIGAFTMVMGHHAGHPDTSALPFSYLIDDRGVSYLAPGVNIRSIGTLRDAQKWPQRDNRTADNRLDLINFSLLNPYTIGRINNAISLLRSMKMEHSETQTYTYNGTIIRLSAIDKGLRLYQLAIDQYIGDRLIERLGQCDTRSDIRKRLHPTAKAGSGLWVDLGGLLAPETLVKKLVDDIVDGKADLNDIANRLSAIANDYDEMAWRWTVDMIECSCHTTIGRIKSTQLCELIERWQSATAILSSLRLDDAAKEFADEAHISYGIDKHINATPDFANVRGTLEASSIAHQLLTIKSDSQHETAKKLVEILTEIL